MTEKMDKYVASIGITLDRFITLRQKEFPYAKGELSQLLRDIALAAKIVNQSVSRSGLADIEGAAGEINIQGEAQQKLDIIAHIRFLRALTKGGEVCAVVSEEEEHLIDTGNPDAKYIVATDPLDGSANIDTNIPTGTIFAIYRRKSEPGTPPTAEDALQKGINQVAAGYVLYGASTMLVYTTGHGVNGFTYEYTLGEFILSHVNIKTPEDGKIYSVNEGNRKDFNRGVNDYLDYCQDNKISSRYAGSLVADFHRNLLKGGIFMYPSTEKAPKGKLRLLYECNPLAFVIEQAGGRAHNGVQRILEIEPTSLHQRAPLVMGSPKMVEKLLECVYKYAPAKKE